VRLSSHGKTPNSFRVHRERYWDLQHLNLQRKSRNSAWWEKHLILQLTKEDRNGFNLGEETHPYSHTVSLEKKEKSSVWSEGIFRPIDCPFGGTTNSLSLVTATYSRVNSESLQNRKKNQRMMRWDSLSSHEKPHIALVWGRTLTQFFHLFHWKRKWKAMHDEWNISSHSSHRQSPFTFSLGGSTHSVLKLGSLQKKQIGNAWWEGTDDHPMADPMGRPQIPSV